VKDANDTSSDWFYADTDGLVNVNSPRNLHGHPNLIDGAGITTRRDVVLFCTVSNPLPQILQEDRARRDHGRHLVEGGIGHRDKHFRRAC
jgi:hypothetical protein